METQEEINKLQGEPTFLTQYEFYRRVINAHALHIWQSNLGKAHPKIVGPTNVTTRLSHDNLPNLARIIQSAGLSLYRQSLQPWCSNLSTYYENL